VSLLAFTVKNLVRPLGLAQLGFPCLLTGTGMAFPWPVIRNASLASSNIVEDMQLSVDLLIAGSPAMFCADAEVTGLLPQQQHAAKSQRTRWEHGHLQTLRTQVPRLLKEWFNQKRFDVLAIALDLCVPPLSLLVMLWLLLTTAALVAGLTLRLYAPVLVLALEGLLILVSVMTAWAKFARNTLPLTTLLSVPGYILWKIPLYLTFLVKPQTKWVRTERDVADSQEL
jgi:cellulose synthase/poly-beta-1,6-N-acetylglucosamine synthase-like glycosyltransferase